VVFWRWIITTKLNIRFSSPGDSYTRSFTRFSSLGIDTQDTARSGRITGSFQWEFDDISGVGVVKESDEMTCYLANVMDCQYVHHEYKFKK